MKLWENVKLALRALVSNKMRSLLTMLGIIIGVGAVITLMSVGEGVQAYITDQFQAIGSNIFFVMPGSMEAELDQPAYLTLRDADALRDSAKTPHVLRLSPTVRRSETVTVPGAEKSAEVRAVSPEYADIRSWYPAVGRFFTEAEDRSGAKVAVLGKIVAEALFPDNPAPIGQRVRINGIPFTVIGVMEEKGGTSFGSEDNVVLIPLGTGLTRLWNMRTPSGEPRLSIIYVQAIDEDSMGLAIQEVKLTLRQRHRLAPGDPDDFTIISQSDLIGTFEQITSVLTIFLGAIAGISLLVGGIGIMNIMLVSVTERTREIGLRKAVGARQSDILWQFLIEAMLLSVTGGFIGIIFGVLGSTLISLVMRSQGFHAVVTLSSVLLATLFAAAVGLFFGIYPAKRAARLHPIDALRYE